MGNDVRVTGQSVGGSGGQTFAFLAQLRRQISPTRHYECPNQGSSGKPWSAAASGALCRGELSRRFIAALEPMASRFRLVVILAPLDASAGELALDTTLGKDRAARRLTVETELKTLPQIVSAVATSMNPSAQTGRWGFQRSRIDQVGCIF